MPSPAGRRPPRHIRKTTVPAFLGWMAVHISRVGLWHPPAPDAAIPHFGADTPCSLLHAFDRAQRAARPLPGEGAEAVEHYDRVRAEVLRLLGRALEPPPGEHPGPPVLLNDEVRWRTLLDCWGDDLTRTTEQAAAFLRDAAAQAGPEVPQPGRPVGEG